MKYKIFFLILFMISAVVRAQDPVTEVLLKVKENNRGIYKYEQYTSSRIMESKTNLTPPNPSFEMDYLWGNEPGTYLQEISVGQEFDFPTVYAKKNNISKKQQEKFLFREQAYKWDVLHETRLLCIELIYLYKMEEEYESRLSDAQQMLKAQQRRLQEGYGTILESEKASLHESLVSNSLQKISSQIRIKKDHLRELNGGREISFESSAYPVFPELPLFDSLFKRVKAVDPEHKMIETGIDESDLEIELAKAKSLPDFEVGYRYEREFLSKFSGLHFGIGIPLWEDKNKVKYSKLKLDYMQAEIAEHELNHYYELKEDYQALLSVVERMNRLDSVFQELKFEDNLNKALNEGEISRIDFYREYSYLYDITDQYLQAEREYFLLMANLFKYELISLL